MELNDKTYLWFLYSKIKRKGKGSLFLKGESNRTPFHTLQQHSVEVDVLMVVQVSDGCRVPWMRENKCFLHETTFTPEMYPYPEFPNHSVFQVFFLAAGMSHWILQLPYIISSKILGFKVHNLLFKQKPRKKETLLNTHKNAYKWFYFLEIKPNY